MKKMMALSALLVLALGMIVVTTRVAAQSGPQAPGGTPGAPDRGPTPTGTWEPGSGPPPNAGSGNAPGSHGTGPGGKPSIYRGVISAVDATTLALTLDDGSSITIGLTEQTRIRVPGPRAQGDVLQPGMQAVAHTVPAENGDPLARSVMMIPGKPALAHRVGTVTGYTAGASITIQAVDGNLYTFALTAGTKILPAERLGDLAVDARVTIIAPRDPAALGWTATAVVVHPPLP